MISHQFNWMGPARHETATAVLVSLRDGADFSEGSLRNRDYQQRRHVAQLVRERLGRIKEELGLIAASPERDPSPPQTDMSLFPTPQKLQSAKDLAASVRTMLVSHGEAFVSYIDGSLHRDIDALRRFNAKAREAITAADPAVGAEIPQETEFSLEPLEHAIAKEVALRKRLDALRIAQDPNYVTTFIFPEGKSLEDVILEEEEKFGSDSTSIEMLEREFQAARAATKQAKFDWNSKANATSKSLVLKSVVRAVSTQLQQEPYAPPSKHSSSYSGFKASQSGS